MLKLEYLMQKQICSIESMLNFIVHFRSDNSEPVGEFFSKVSSDTKESTKHIDVHQSEP